MLYTKTLIVYNVIMGLFNNTTKQGKRTGIMGAIFAVVAIAQATRTLKTYLEERKKKK